MQQDWDQIWTAWSKGSRLPEHTTQGPGAVCALLPRLRDSADPVPALASLSVGLSPLWQVRAAWLLAALNLDRLQPSKAQACAAALERCLLQHSPTLSPLDEGRIHNLRGRLASLRGALEDAQGHFQQAVLSFASTHEGREMAYALANAGNLRSRLGRPLAALDAYTRALELLPAVQSRGNKALMGLLLNLGVLCYKQGDTLRAHRTASLARDPLLFKHATGALRLSLDHLLAVVNTETGAFGAALDAIGRAEHQAEALASLRSKDSLVLQRAWLSQAEGAMLEALAWLQTPPRLPRARLPELSWQVCNAIVEAALSPSPATLQRLESWREPCARELPPSASEHLKRAIHRQRGLADPEPAPALWPPEAHAALERLDALLDGVQQQLAGLRAARIAHDLNNTLTVLNSELWMLQQDHPSADLALMKRSTELLQSLSAELMTMERSARQQSQDLGQCVRENLGLYRRLMGTEIQLEARGCMDPLPVGLGRVEVHKVLLNLLANARESIAPSPGQVQIVLERSSEHAWLHVDDTGTGIPVSLRTRILEPGFSTSKASGRGLGLSVVDEIVRKSGGRIVIAESAAGGARVGVRLPLTPGPSGP